MNGHNYYGPHKWIVCLIGSDAYTVKDFMDRHAINRTTKQLSISIMGLSGEPFEMHVGDYKDLVKSTKEGVFVNIVNTRCAESSKNK